MDEKPLVSVIVCVYNTRDYLREAVLSVLGQTYRNLEVIVVDDGSTDGSIEAIADLDDPRLKILRQPNQGKPTALNNALDVITGDYYAIQDSDDVADPRRIELQLAAFLADPELGGVFSGHELILNGRRVAPRFRGRSKEECRADIEVFRMPAHDATAMYRVSMVRGMRYEPDFRQGEGYDYILRVGERFPIAVVGECLYSYRVHPTSITRSSPADRMRHVFQVLRRACERRGISFEERFGAAAGETGNASEGRLRNRDADNNLAAHFIESVLDLRWAKRRGEALRTALQCSALHPLDIHYQKPLMYATVPIAVVSAVRSK